MKRIGSNQHRVPANMSTFPDIIEISDSEEGEIDIPQRHVSPAETDYEGDEGIIIAFEDSGSLLPQTATSTSAPDGIPERPVSRAESIYEGDESLIIAFDDSTLSLPQSATQYSKTCASSKTPSSSNSNAFADPSTGIINVLGKRRRDNLSSSIGNVTKMPKLKGTMDSNEPYMIAHDPVVERLLDSYNIGHGLRYELARLISTGTKYKSITSDRLRKLQKELGEINFSASVISNLFRDDVKLFDDEHRRLRSAEHEATSPWRELEKEESALAHDPDAGIGNNPDLPGYHGGKVVFLTRLVEAPNSPYGVKLELEPSFLGPSSRFTRQFGSMSFLRIKVPDKMLYAKNNSLHLFFKKPFILWDKTFRAVYAKEGTVFMFWTNEQYRSSSKISGRLSIEEYLNWCNPVSENANQLMTKWSARMALGFSTSVPGPVISQENLREWHDEMSPDGQSDMTDGCGFTSMNVHLMVARQLQLNGQPTAIQFRLAGFKGLTVFQDDKKHDDVVWAKLRPSQKKINFPKGRKLPPSLRTIDILCTSRLSTSTRLSHEVMVNLHENGVDADFFVKLLRQGLRRAFDELTTWDGPDAMVNLCVNVFRAENIYSARKGREATGEGRARGFTNRTLDDRGYDEDRDEDDLDLQGITERSTAWWGDVVSGCPSSLGETVVSLIFAGFIPQKCPVLRDKLKNILDTILEREATGLRLEVLQSCTGFAIPDPLGVLGENQIYVKSSRQEFALDDGTMSDILVGDCLVTRNPCKTPSDVRKVQAVRSPQLDELGLHDVVVFSIKGKRRSIEYLAGGDYDGDKVLVYWDKQMVDGFQNADDKFSREPPVVDTHFTRDSENGQRFLQRLQDQNINTEESRIREFQKYLLGALQCTSLVGTYSMWHDKAIYEYGYDHPYTQIIAATFCRLLDSSKTGYRLKPDVFEQDQKIFSAIRAPAWKEQVKKRRRQPLAGNDTNVPPMPRRIKKAFIMDILLDAGQRELGIVKEELRQIFPMAGSVANEDADLARPWRDFSSERRLRDFPANFVELRRHDIASISAHVEDMYAQERVMLRNATKNKSFTSYHITTRQDALRQLSRTFAASPKVDEVITVTDEATLRRICASYAYVYDREKRRGGYSRFPFNVALRELGLIKAQADGVWMPFLNKFCDKMRLHNPARKRA